MEFESEESSSNLNTFNSINIGENSEGYFSCGSDRNKFVGHLNQYNELKKDIKLGDKYARRDKNDDQSFIEVLTVSMADEQIGAISTLNIND